MTRKKPVTITPSKFVLKEFLAKECTAYCMRSN